MPWLQVELRFEICAPLHSCPVLAAVDVTVARDRGISRMVISFLSLLRKLLFACLVALVCGPMCAGGALAGADPMENARRVGEKICANCHDTEKSLFGHTQ